MIDTRCDIDRETIERYALGRPGDLDSEFFSHIETCADCKERIAEARDWAALLKKALQE
jgi:hypothetical protein